MATGSLHYWIAVRILCRALCTQCSVVQTRQHRNSRLSLKAVAPARHDDVKLRVVVEEPRGQLYSSLSLLLLPCCRKCNEPLRSLTPTSLETIRHLAR